MAILGKPQGVFDLNNSDNCVGSYILKSDIKEILNVNDNDMENIEFLNINGNEVCDERTLQKSWYSGEIKNVIPANKSSLDELFLLSIIKKTYPNIIIERQCKVLRYSLDLKLTLGDKQIFIEFDGPYHFAKTRFGVPKNILIKKQAVQDKTGIEVVNWAYWIQRCSSNVKAIFENNIKGYGALWSTEILFGMFYFENSAQIIDDITKRFNAVDDSGYGYFYGSNTRNRNNPQHPIIEKIKMGKRNIELLLPKGYKDIDYWLPEELKTYNNYGRKTECLEKLEVAPKIGNENLIYNDNLTNWKVIDFWKWSASDLLSNSTRGIFAEFIVATALEIDLTKVREEWEAYDLETKEGIKIEIKTSAYLQTWFQDDYSKIIFSIKPASSWSAKTNELLTIKARYSDIYIFCLLNHKDKNTVNPLNLSQWVFYVLSTKKINKYFGDKKSISLKTLEKYVNLINYDQLKETVQIEYIGSQKES